MKTLYKIFSVIIILNIIGIVYYTLLLYGFSWFGIFVTTFLTILPFLSGIYLFVFIDKIRKNVGK